MTTFDCVLGIIGSLISIIGILFGRNGGAYMFVLMALCLCVINLIDNIQHSGDVVKVVRCKGCKNIKTMSDGKTLACLRMQAYRNPNDFCNHGEKALKEREKE